tara:strand:- start:44 stop:256 length:213 start_codon:yes stop_codon:yes gene_type:complete
MLIKGCLATLYLLWKNQTANFWWRWVAKMDCALLRAAMPYPCGRDSRGQQQDLGVNYLLGLLISKKVSIG